MILCETHKGICANDADSRRFREDCAPGTCYEGTCLGDDIYSTDNTCGYEHGHRRCAGKWGDCCGIQGRCGTGSAFCSKQVCLSGNCAKSSSTSSPRLIPPGYFVGNTTDGTCGGVHKYTCDPTWGSCCNKNNIYGSMPSDCGEGW